MRTPITRLLLVATILFAFKPTLAQDDYVPNDLLRYYVRQSARVNATFVPDEPSDQPTYDDRFTSELVFYSIVDAIVPPDIVRKAQDGLETSRWMAETSRTDQQIGASPGTSGTTTLVEKAGLPRWLAAAVEYGAIEQERNGTSITLTASPYAALALANGGDTAENFDQFALWRRFAVSATGQIDSGNGNNADELEFEDLAAVSAKVRLLGDRSTRTPEFTKIWEENFNQSVDRIVRSETLAFSEILDDVLVDGKPIESSVDAALATKLTAARTLAEGEARVAAMEAVIFDVLKKNVYDAILGPSPHVVSISDDAREAIINGHVPAIFSAYQERVKAAANVKAIMAKLEKSRLLTLGADSYQVDDGSDYTTIKLLYQDAIERFDILANGDISLNHKPGMDQDTVRDFGGSLAIECAFDNTITGNFDSHDLSKIVLSVGAKVLRFEDAKDEGGIIQVKVDMPVYKGFNLPLAFSWASRTEEKDEQEFRINVGGGLNTDKLLALSQMVLGR